MEVQSPDDFIQHVVEAVRVDHLRHAFCGEMHTFHHKLEFIHHHVDKRNIPARLVFAEAAASPLSVPRAKGRRV
jgi:hypothetical protein